MQWLFAIALLAIAIDTQAASPALWAGLQPGQFAVGYLHLESGGTIDVWYPSAAPGEPLTFARILSDHSAATRSFLEQRGLSADSIARLLDAPMFGTREAEPIHAAWPLVLIAHGNGEDAADQAVLAEYVASHGYLVVSVPSPMIRQPMTDASQIASFAEQQADALEAAMRRAAGLFRVRRERVAVISHSFGSRSALLFVMRHPSTRALVSLDGGIGTSNGVAEMRGAPSFRGEEQLPPILHIYEDLDAFMDTNLAFLRSLHTRRLRIEHTDDMHHVHFTSYGFAAATIPEFARVTNAGPKIRLHVERTARSVLRFLDTELE